MTEPITDHVAQGLSRLIEQYQDKPRIRGWIQSYLEEVQELSDEIWATLLNRLIDHATGVHLEVLGKIVGQPRREEDEERYRTLVRARVAVNRSSGTVNDLIGVASLVLDGRAARVIEVFPASVLVDVAEPMDFADLAFELLDEARVAGVALTLHWFDGHDADEALAWADGDEFQDDGARGFGGDDPDVGPGGYLVGAL